MAGWAGWLVGWPVVGLCWFFLLFAVLQIGTCISHVILVITVVLLLPLWLQTARNTSSHSSNQGDAPPLNPNHVHQYCGWRREFLNLRPRASTSPASASRTPEVDKAASIVSKAHDRHSRHISMVHRGG